MPKRVISDRNWRSPCRSRRCAIVTGCPGPTRHRFRTPSIACSLNAGAIRFFRCHRQAERRRWTPLRSSALQST